MGTRQISVSSFGSIFRVGPSEVGSYKDWKLAIFYFKDKSASMALLPGTETNAGIGHFILPIYLYMEELAVQIASCWFKNMDYKNEHFGERNPIIVSETIATQPVITIPALQPGLASCLGNLLLAR